MSLDYKVYCQKIPSNAAKRLAQELNQLDMRVEVHPDFNFDEEEDAGFVPFKFTLKSPYHPVLAGKELKSGFELYIDDFALEEEKKSLQPKLSFFDKIRGKKPAPVVFAPEAIEKRLASCNKAISFVFHAGDSFELRFAYLSAAILAQLTNGLCHYPADDIWYDNKQLVENALKEIQEYEHSLSQEELEYHEFDQW